MGIEDLNSSISGAIKNNPILKSAMGTISAALQAGATKASLESGTFYDKHAAHSAVLGPGQEEVITETRSGKTGDKRAYTSTAGNVHNGYMGLTILPITYPVGGLKQLMGANYATVRGVVEELPSISLTSEWKSTDDIGGFASDVIYESVKEIPLVGSAVALAEQFASVARNELIRVGGVAGGYQRKKRYWTHTGPISFQIKFKSVDFNGTGEPMRVMAKLFSYAVPVTPTNDASADDIFQALLAVVTICASVGADIATAGMTVLDELGDLVPKGVKDLLSACGGAALKGLSAIIQFGGGIASGKTSADLKASAKVDEAEAAVAAEITSEKPVTNLSKEQQDAYDAYVKSAKGKKGDGTPKGVLEWWTAKQKSQVSAGVKNGLAEITDLAAAGGTLVGSVVGGAARIAGGVGKVFTSAIGSDDLRKNSMNLMANGIYSALYNWAQEMQDATTLRYAPPTVRVIIGDFFDNDDMIITSVSEQPSKEQTRNGPLWIEFTIQVESRGDIDGFERIGLQVNSSTALETARRLGIAEGKGGEWGEMLDMVAFKKNYGTGINIGDNHRPTNSTNYYYDGSQRDGKIGGNGGHGEVNKTGKGNWRK